MTLPDGDQFPAPIGTLRDYFQSLLQGFGPQGWWPARTRLEVILGAILTQNTTWRNASLALDQVRKHGLLRMENLRKASLPELERHVRQAGFYRQKAATILSFIGCLNRDCRGSLDTLFSMPSDDLRRYLLDIKGLGPETADAILLYAGRKPYFVADAYTRRILSRHGWLPANATYEAAQELLHQQLPRDSRLFNEFHALLVEAGKRYCTRREPACSECPLREYLATGSRAAPGELAALSAIN
ncbi:MAG TPA: endonuclease III domain-containing protein [Terriglobia bacterium]|nr:endonuclease III domain-containing protein [Terriglobia bacterium]